MAKGYKLSNHLLDAALKYNSLGLSVIPIKPRDKKPLVKWEEYQSKLATPEEIIEWWKSTPNANIGIVTGKVSGIFVIDLDKHDPAYSEEIALQYIPDTCICPTVNTPKGGQHLYFKCPDEQITIGARILPGIDYRGNGGYVVAPPSVSGNNKGYEWVVNFDRAMLTLPPKEAINKISTNNIKECKKLTNLTKNDLTKPYTDYKILQSGSRDDDLFHIANWLLKGGRGISYTRQVLEILAKNCNPPFPEREVEAKIKSALDRAERKERSLSAEIREFVTLQEGYFDLTFAYMTLQILTKEEKNNAMVIFNRLCKEGVLEKYGNRRGCYIPVKPVEENIIDLNSIEATCLPVRLPLGIHELVKIMPKNIIIVAGESNSGKSAFLLNIAAKNMKDHKVFYFSSEMGGSELKERLQNFSEKVPMKEWNKCTFIERATDFDVAIRPDDINIIDFLEIHDDFYKVGGYIKKIFDKLNNGIAIIAIQKNIGRDEGVGGARSIEKARLYLSMRPGTIKIVKAKNWVSSLMNPNGLEKDFKLAKGMIFTEASGWEHAKN